MRGMRPVLVKRLIFCVDGQNRRSPSVALLVEGNVRVQLKAKRCAGKTMKEQHQCLQSFQFIPWRSFSSVPSFSMFHSWVIRYIVTLCAGVAVATPTSINRRGRELSAYIQAATQKYSFLIHLLQPSRTMSSPTSNSSSSMPLRHTVQRTATAQARSSPA